MRGYAAIGGVAWLAIVTLAAAGSAIGLATAVLFAVLGLLVLGTLATIVTTHRLLQRVLAGVSRLDTSKIDADLNATGNLVRRDLRKTFRQVEAMQNLYAILDIQHALPASRGFPASPDLLLFLVDLVDRHRPRMIVECGSGLSTLCLALAMRRFGIDGKVVALEHLAEYAEQSEELLRRHEVGNLAEVRRAPLEPFAFDGSSIDWYAEVAWKDLDGIDLLFVDGPPSKLSRNARYPSIPLLYDRLAASAHIVLDDYARTKEKAVVERWRNDYPSLVVENISLEKGAALLTRR
ncbi:class I SAM-dependent methyltransferase [Actinopolymorpha sp. B17G11]|uniref:class I SAM-dependent methyltransferase n=1 Tax=Actinopolymorpha sp. B17G11 TaxID=3160861 RepID=UPI0032E483D6